MNSAVSPVISALLAATLGALAAMPVHAAGQQPSRPGAASQFTADVVNAAGKDDADSATPAAVAARPARTTRAARPAKASSAAVLRAQVLLDRAHFGAGEIDGAAGGNLTAALTGYQKAHALPVDGTLNAATWAALNADPSDALITYTLTEQDVAGPFEAAPESMAEKAKLSSLGYASIDEALGERFHASPALLKKLNPGQTFTRAGEQIVVPNVEGAAPLPKGGKIVVNKGARTLTLFDTDGKAVAQFPSSTGSTHDPLPLGQWKVKGISKNPVFWYNPKLFWDAKPGEAKAKIPAGPNNPVGVAWIDLSKPHYGIHGTPVPASIGKTESHGCIRLTNWDVTLLVSAVGAGTQVELQE